MKNSKRKKLVAFLISLMFSSRIRVYLYRKIFGYYIIDSFLGWKTVICVDSAELIECKIDSINEFSGPISIVVKKGSYINKKNRFLCGSWASEEKNILEQYDRTLEIGENCRISESNYFDITGALVMGDDSLIAGTGSQFWTHGAGKKDRNIFIGNNCYISSAVRFAPGSSINNNTIVSLGSIVTKSFQDENLLIGGQPAKILKNRYDWRTRRMIN